jgi:membrane protein DedA with SNARE-associated domain
VEDFFPAVIKSISGPYGYVLLAVSAFFENIVPPIPGDTVTVFGGYLVGSGRLTLTGSVLATTAGSFAGFMVMYAVGRFLGHELLKHGGRVFAPATIDKVHGWFERYGVGVVIANRFLSGARSVISICAGIARLNPWLVAGCCLMSCLAWNWLLIWAGSKVGENWGMIIEMLKKYNAVMAVALALGVAVWIARSILQRRAQRAREKKY